MSASPDILNSIAEATKGIKEIKETAVTKAEVAEKIDKLAERIKGIEDDAKKMVTRMGTPGDFRPSAVKKMVDRGVRSMTARGDAEQMEAATALGSVYKTAPDGRFLPELRLDQDEIELLELAERVKIMDAIASYDRNWEKQKATLGEEEAFKRKFPKTARAWGAAVQEFRKTTGQLDTATSGLGSDWVPTLMSSTLTDAVRLATPELNMFQMLTMPSASWTWPIKSGVSGYYVKAQAAATTKSSLATSSIAFTARLGAIYTTWTDEIVEDSIIAILPAIRADFSRALAEGKSMAIVNGDLTGFAGTHMDDDTNTAGAYQAPNLLYGLRYYALKGSAKTKTFYDAGTLAVLTSTIIATAAKQMGKYALNRNGDVVCLVGVKHWLELQLLDANLITVDKYGPNATIITGERGSVYGIPVVVSYAMDQRAAAGLKAGNGLNESGGPNTSGQALIVHRPSWVITDRRQDTIEQDKDITTGISTLVLTNRWDFGPIYRPASYPTGGAFNPDTEPHVCVIGDLTLG